MFKLFLIAAAVIVIGGCSESEKGSISQHITDEPTTANNNSASLTGEKTRIEPTPPTTPSTKANSTIASTSTNILDDNINEAFAAPDSRNNALFDDIISNIVSSKKTVNFSSQASENELNLVKLSCQKIDAKLASVSLDECLKSNLRTSFFSSQKDFPILITEFPPLASREPLGKILVIGGTHGDELTSISIIFKWISILQKYHSGLFHWHIAPLMNPDGALLKRATRSNASKIDLNRNMPTPDWYRHSSDRWKKIGKDPRKNPGLEPASEPETQWLIHEIETFKPDAIISVHAPYGILDFDAPDLSDAPKSFGRLRLNLLGTYPGSLGNYAGINRDIPVLTLELPHAWVMPKPYEINEIWTDMIGWLKLQLAHN